MVTNKAEGTPLSYNVSTENGKELRRKRSQIRQIPQKPSKHVSFDLRTNQLHQFTPNTERLMAKTIPCQYKERLRLHIYKRWPCSTHILNRVN